MVNSDQMLLMNGAINTIHLLLLIAGQNVTARKHTQYLLQACWVNSAGELPVALILDNLGLQSSLQKYNNIN